MLPDEGLSETGQPLLDVEAAQRIIRLMKTAGFIALLVNLGLGVTALSAAQQGPRRIENPQTIMLPGGARVEFKHFSSPAIGKEAAYSVFLPPSYEKDPQARFPVVYFLHGLWNDDTSWAVERYGGIPAQLEELMVRGDLPEFLLVNPNGENSFYTDYLDGKHNYERMVFDDLIHHVESTYRVIPERWARALGGVSMGGYGALKIGMKHPDLYAAVAGVSPIVFPGDDPSEYFRDSSSRMAQYLVQALKPVYGMPFDKDHWHQNSVLWLARNEPLDDLKLFFAYGTADRYNRAFPLAAGIQELDQILTSRHVSHEYRVYENGPHGWQLVVDHLQEVARFLSQSFAQTNEMSAAGGR